MMRSAANVLFCLAMAPIGLLASNLRTAHQPEFDVQKSAAVVVEAEHGGARAHEQERRELSYATDLSDLLELHNEARCLHNADDLVYTTALKVSARTHAKALASDCGDLYHSSSSYGENVFRCSTKGSTSCFTAAGAMKALYENEIKGASSVTEYGGHATQILWQSTTQLGCAMRDCTSGNWNHYYLVCQYNPAGNNLAIVEQEVDLLSSGNSC